MSLAAKAITLVNFYLINPIELFREMLDRIRPEDLICYFIFHSYEKLRPVWLSYLRKSPIVEWPINCEIPVDMLQVINKGEGNLNILAFIGCQQKLETGHPLIDVFANLDVGKLKEIMFVDFDCELNVGITSDTLEGLRFEDCRGLKELRIDLPNLRALKFGFRSFNFYELPEMALPALHELDLEMVEVERDFIESFTDLRIVRFKNCHIHHHVNFLLFLTRNHRMEELMLYWRNPRDWDLPTGSHHELLKNVYEAVANNILDHLVKLTMSYQPKNWHDLRNADEYYCEHLFPFSILPELRSLHLIFGPHDNYPFTVLLGELQLTPLCEVTYECPRFDEWPDSFRYAFGIFHLCSAAVIRPRLLTFLSD